MQLGTPPAELRLHNAVRALNELHQGGPANETIVHRNLTVRTILVRHDGTAIFTGFERSKIPSEISVASSGLPTEHQATFAPEVRAQGFAAADHRSDLYSLCACVMHAFTGRPDGLSQRAAVVIARGLVDQPEERATLDELEVALSEQLGESIPPPPAPPARFWTEDQIIRFRERDYRILARLGSGGVGTTFKVVEIDRSTREDLGTYVAKVAHDGAAGNRVLRAYSLVRSHLRHTALSTIFEVAREWQENQFIALMTWVSGAPLSEFMGVFPLLAEEQGEPSGKVLAVRWLRVVCEALDVLHRNGLVHGDVSPRNLIVSGGDVVLTDYDFVGKIGEPLSAPGTVLYCSPSYQEGRPASPSDDLYALAASFFHVMFESEPFRYGQELDKRRGLNWEGLRRDESPIMAPFLDRATHPDAEEEQVGLDQLLMIRLAQALGAAPDKLRGNEGERISNQHPIAERAARQFSEDIRRFVRSYAHVIPRHAFVALLESCMAVGLTTIVTSVIELLFDWADTGEIRKSRNRGRHISWWTARTELIAVSADSPSSPWTTSCGGRNACL